MRVLSLSLLLALLAFYADATTYVFKTNLSSNAMPINLVVNGVEYWLFPGNEKIVLELSGHINYSCTDAYGQDLRIETARMDDGYIYAYIGGMMASWSNHGKRRIWGYKNGSIIDYSNDSGFSHSNDDDSGYSQDESSDSSDYDELVQRYGSPEDNANKVIDGIGKGGSFVAGLISNGDRQFMIRALFSRAWGTGGRFEARFGGGVAFAIYGGMGKSLAWELDNMDKLSWHVGIGLAIPLASGDLMDPYDVSFGLTYGETPIMANKAMMLDVGYSHYFGRSKRFGLFASAGVGLGNFNEDVKDWFSEDNRHIIWDVTAGLTFRL